jgi:hypothetical protein
LFIIIRLFNFCFTFFALSFCAQVSPLPLTFWPVLSLSPAFTCPALPQVWQLTLCKEVS